LTNKAAGALGITPMFDPAWDQASLTKTTGGCAARPLTTAAVRQHLSSGLLRCPYLAVQGTAGAVPAREFTSYRKIAGAVLDGFVDASAVGRLLVDGASVVLPQVSHWSAPVRRLSDQLEAEAQCVVSPTAWWCLRTDAPAVTLRAGERLLLLQLAGCERWLRAGAGRPPRTAADRSADAHAIRLDPGDLLYVPSGELVRHGGRTGESLYLVLEMSYPAPQDLARALSRLFAADNPRVAHYYHAKTLEQRTADVRAALRVTAAGIANEPAAFQVMAADALRERSG
jgi:hypothetical protein